MVDVTVTFRSKPALQGVSPVCIFVLFSLKEIKNKIYMKMFKNSNAILQSIFLPTISF